MSKKNYEVKFELNGEIDPRLMRSFDDLSRDVTGLEKDLGLLRRSKGLDKITYEAVEAQGAFHDLQENVKEFGEVFERTLQFTGAHKIITTIGDMFSNMVGEVGALDDSVHQMGAATGATVEEMAQFKDTIQEIYKSNYGEGFNDIANALVNVRQVTGLTGDALEGATKNALILRDTFGYDVNETVRTVDALMRNMGVTAEQAFNLIAQGSQKGLNRSDDLLDTLNEYSVHFKDAGYNAEEMFSILEAGIKSGTFNGDKMGDLLKEFNIKIKSGDKAVVEAMDTLFSPAYTKDFISSLTKGGTKVKEYGQLVKEIGKDAATDLVKSLQKGGAGAQKASGKIASAISGSNQIFKGLSDGSIQARDALDKIITQLDGVKDAQQRNQLAVGLFGTQYEDLRASAVSALQETNGEYNKTLGTMKQIEEVKYSSVTKDLHALGRELMDSVVIPIGEDLMPVLQNLVAWASENKDVIKTLALAVPAGMLAKNAVSMGKDFAKVGKSLMGTVDKVGKFGGAVGLLTNPIGLAVGALGALTVGVISYKRHQEEARQELLNMGDELGKAYSDYSAVEEQTRKTQELITEYDRLKTKIDDINTPAGQLTEARRKMAEVEKELIELNPDILKAEDAKLDSFRQQLDVANQINQTQLQKERRDLESKVLDTEANLPNLVGEYDTMLKNVGEYEKTYLEAKEGYAKFTDYADRASEIYQTTPEASEERERQLNSLADEIYKETGKDFITRMGNLSEAKKQYKDLYDSIRTKLDETQSSISDAEGTYQELYDQQIRLIEIQELGGETIQNQAAKYSKLTDEEKQRVDMAIQNMTELNRVMDDIPLSKKVNIELIWQQTGMIPDMSTPAGKKLKQIQLRDPGFEEYANGGIVDSPELAWVGEGGDREFIIPDNNSQRSHALYAAAGEALGYDKGGIWAPVFNMNITVNGKTDREVIVEAANDSYREWEKNMRKYEQHRQRVSLI